LNVLNVTDADVDAATGALNEAARPSAEFTLTGG
jgi:hypothetical protein